MENYKVEEGMVIELNSGDRCLLVKGIFRGIRLTIPKMEYEKMRDNDTLLTAHKTVKVFKPKEKPFVFHNINNITDEYLVWSKKEDNKESKFISMKLQDLKTKMVVETSSNSRYVVVGDVLVGDVGCLSLKEYNKDLTYKGDCDGYDIVEVYNPKNIDHLSPHYFKKIPKTDLIWGKEGMEIPEQAKK